MVLPRPRNILPFVYFAVTFTSAVVAGLILASSLVPPSTMEVLVQIVPSPGAISYPEGYSFPEITFQTPPLDSRTTYYGNVTLCCLFKMPGTANGVTYFSTPELFVFSQSEYITSSATPMTSPPEVSINGETFSNYTLNGTAGTEILSIEFTPKDSGIYYFVVESRNGETQAQLRLTYYTSQIVENKWPSRFQAFYAVLSILGLIVGPIGTLRTPRAREEMIQSALGR